jgi:hypothetical protein
VRDAVHRRPPASTFWNLKRFGCVVPHCHGRNCHFFACYATAVLLKKHHMENVVLEQLSIHVDAESITLPTKFALCVIEAQDFSKGALYNVVFLFEMQI